MCETKGLSLDNKSYDRKDTSINKNLTLNSVNEICHSWVL